MRIFRFAASALVLVLVTAACSDDRRPLFSLPECFSDEMILVAQSVPGADYVPCFADLPQGWALDDMHVGDDGALVVLDSDRAGDEAASLVYEEGCEVEGFDDVTSEPGDITRLDRIGEALESFELRHIILFDGGCVTVDFSFQELDGARPQVLRSLEYSNELLESLQLFSRADINAEISRENERIQV